MARFKPILMEKVEEEERKEKKQERLKKRTGIEDDDVVLKEKGMKDYLKSAVRGVLYMVFVVLIFIGVVTVINPVSQSMLVGIVRGILP